MALAGCAPSQPTSTADMRAAKAPMYSTAGFPVARLQGTWQQVAGFGAPCSPAPAITFAPQGGAMQANYDLCLGAARAVGAGPLASGGAQGRYRLDGLPAPLWVLWMDEGNRTMALGTPDGSYGLVVSKDIPSPDRVAAAREILAWNGYDLTYYVQFAP
jgi:apolipoprotein D and lipocalin family protein